MADKNLLSQMLEHLVNEDQAKAEELFHDYVVAASREIYEGLIESELQDEEVDEASDEEDKEEDKVDEAAEEDEDKDDEDLDENFEDIAVEADDEMDMDADATDDLTGELDAEEDEEGEEGEEQLFQDLEAIVDELQAKFDELKGDDHEEPDADNMGGPSDMDADNMMKDEFELETVREYVEKVGNAKMGDNGANAKSIVAGKNDMGGTTANIAKGGEAKGEGTAGGLAKPTTQLQDGGNVNVPGGNAGKTAFKKKETAKAGDDGDKSAAGLFRGRR
jgi:hypothetical protein